MLCNEMLATTAPLSAAMPVAASCTSASVEVSPAMTANTRSARQSGGLASACKRRADMGGAKVPTEATTCTWRPAGNNSAKPMAKPSFNSAAKLSGEVAFSCTSDEGIAEMPPKTASAVSEARPATDSAPLTQIGASTQSPLSQRKVPIGAQLDLQRPWQEAPEGKPVQAPDSTELGATGGVPQGSGEHFGDVPSAGSHSPL
mmetsp:Transcript_92235/g.298299  ORF Transcript_92235/g.298299 Transcript_92235/m.298299 type:complete len:202 (+) Transcript_92235:856-1461(+)